MVFLHFLEIMKVQSVKELFIELESGTLSFWSYIGLAYRTLEANGAEEKNLFTL